MTTGNSGKQYVRRMRTQGRKAAQASGREPVGDEVLREQRSGEAAPLAALADHYQRLPGQPEDRGGHPGASTDLAYQPASEQPDLPGANEPQIVQDIVAIVKAELNQQLASLPVGPHQGLLLRFNRTPDGAYQARFPDSDHSLVQVLERARHEGAIQRSSSGEIVGFTTAKGSTYELKGNATKRFKKVKGQQYGFSNRTVYVTKEDAFRLPRLIRSGGVPEIRNGELWVDFAKARGRGLDYPDEKILSTDTPTKRLHPFEELPRKNGHRNWHIGNEIVEIDTGGSSVGYSDFQLTSRGRSELHRLEQQLVEHLATNTDVPARFGLAVQVLEQGTQARDIVARAAQAAIETDEHRLGRHLTDAERHAIYRDYLDSLGQEMADQLESVVNDLL